MAQLIRERFSKGADPFAAGFVTSVENDARLLPYDLQGTRAHARMLHTTGLLTEEELRKIEAALGQIEREWAEGTRKLSADLEDVHMNVEQWLIDLAGPAGAKIHTARSRNDQVAVDLRLYLRDAAEQFQTELRGLRSSIVAKAAEHSETLLPGFTHLQRAQPILLGHALLSFDEALARDEGRLADALKRLDVSPLGACALAGTSLPVDPRLTARELGFSTAFANSIDAVSDRDFIAEVVFFCALLQVHLSQIAENLLLWSTTEFGFLSLPDELCTSSSIMPQKKNADMIELVRGKVGRAVGDLVNLLVTLKALPMGYNRDLQESKPPLFDALDTARASARAIRLAIEGMNVNRERMARAADDPQLMATDIAEWLVERGVPFREAHGAVARVMREVTQGGRTLKDLSPAEWKKFSPHFTAEVGNLLSARRSVENKKSPGSTGTREVKERLKEKKSEIGHDEVSKGVRIHD